MDYRAAFPDLHARRHEIARWRPCREIVRITEALRCAAADVDGCRPHIRPL